MCLAQHWKTLLGTCHCKHYHNLKGKFFVVVVVVVVVLTGMVYRDSGCYQWFSLLATEVTNSNSLVIDFFSDFKLIKA